MSRVLALFLFTFLVVSANAAISPMGGQDSGGGNTADGKALESYLVDPSTLPGFTKLTAQFRVLNANRDTELLLAATLRKNWYFVPGPLSTLPANRVGSAVAVDQAALQDFSAVWIDSTLFGNLKEEEQATLLLHEIILSYRLYPLNSDLARCRVVWYSLRPDFCDGKSHQPTGKPSDLTADDYETVRSIVRELLDHPDIAESDLLRSFNDGGFSFDDFTFRLPLRKPEPADLFQAFSTAALSHSWPSFGYEQPDAVTLNLLTGVAPTQSFKSNATCHFQVKADAKHNTFTMTITADDRAPYVLHVNPLTADNARSGGYFFYVDSKGQLIPEPDTPDRDSVTIGTKVTWVDIKLSDIGFRDGNQYMTIARLAGVRVLKGVRVDELGNDSIFNEQSVNCTMKPEFDGTYTR